MKDVLERKLSEYIERSKNNALPIVAEIMNTANDTQDYIWNIKGNGGNQYFINEGGKLVANIGATPPMSLHKHSLGQIAERMSIPSGYLRTLAENNVWGVDLATNILNEHLRHSDRQRLLVREVKGEIRGVLSDSYRRLNTLQLFDVFIKGASANNAVFTNARFDGLKSVLEVVRPEIIEFKLPSGDIEYVCFGAVATNSDFGAGSYQIRMFVLKPVCSNGAIGRSFINQRHLGSRIPDDIVVSENTMKKDTEFFASLTEDTISTLFSPKYKDEYIAKIEKSAKTEIDMMAEIEKLPKIANFTKGETEHLDSLLMNSKESDGLNIPPTLWKLTNGVTALARDIQTEKPMRALELQEFAGSLLDNIKLN